MTSPDETTSSIVRTGGENRPLYPVGSVDNALQLLMWSQESSRLQAAEAAERLGVSRSTAYRLIALLAEQGFLVRDDTTSTLLPGPAYRRLAKAAVDRLEVLPAGSRVIRELRDELGETVGLAVLVGADALLVDVAEGLRPLRVVDQVGDIMSAHLSAAGKAMLSQLPEDELPGRFPDEMLAQPTRSAIGTRTELRNSLTAARRRGWATNRGESGDRAVGLAAAVRSATGAVVGSVTVLLPDSRVHDDFEADLGPRVAAAAARVSRLIGRDQAVRGLAAARDSRSEEPQGVDGRKQVAFASVTNALAILNLLADCGHRGVSDVAREIGVAVSTAHRLLATMQYRGFVVQERARSYRLGPELVRMGLDDDATEPVDVAVTDALESLSTDLDETTSLWLPAGTNLECAQVITGSGRVRVVEEVGTRVAGSALLHPAAEGKAQGDAEPPVTIQRQDGTVRLALPVDTVGGHGALVVSVGEARFDQHRRALLERLTTAAQQIRAARTG